MKYLILLIILLSPKESFADSGKILLKNGNCFIGDIKKQGDGSCWVYVNKCMVKFSRNEIKKLLIYSKEIPLRGNPGSSRSEKTRSSKDESKYDEIINYAARKNNLDPALIKAVVKAESNFNNLDVSNKGAQGLMQLMPGTASGLGVSNSYEPGANIHAGTLYLKYMLELFDWDLEKALAAYNAGPGAVIKYQNVPPYKETRGYIKNVYRNYQSYRHSNKIYTYTDDSGCLNIYNIKRKPQ